MHRPHLHDGYVPSAWRICIARMTDIYRLYDGMYRLHETPVTCHGGFS